MRLAVRSLLAITVVAFATQSFAATESTSYGWEDGTGTILGFFGNVANPANVTTGDEIIADFDTGVDVVPNSGSRMLTADEDPHFSTPQAYVAYIEGLDEGDTVTASFYGWDSTDSASPSLRIWGHWANDGDVNSYAGSAGGNTTYTANDPGDPDGWYQVGNTWNIPAGVEALVVEARMYSSPTDGDYATSYFVDDLAVEVTSHYSDGGFSITTPGGTTNYVPEPASIALMLMGVLGLIGIGRAKR